MPSNQKKFVLEVDERAIVAFDATNDRKARTMCRQAWFVDELSRYRSNGRPLIGDRSNLSLRRANPVELVELEVAETHEVTRGDYTGEVFAFLVPIDVWTH